MLFKILTGLSLACLVVTSIAFSQENDKEVYQEIMSSILPQVFYKMPTCGDFFESTKVEDHPLLERISKPPLDEFEYRKNLEVYYSLLRDSIWLKNHPCLKFFYKSRLQLSGWRHKPILLNEKPYNLLAEIMDSSGAHTVQIKSETLMMLKHQVETFLAHGYHEIHPSINYKILEDLEIINFFPYSKAEELKKEIQLLWDNPYIINLYNLFLSKDRKRAVVFLKHDYYWLRVIYLERIGNRWYSFLTESF